MSKGKIIALVGLLAIAVALPIYFIFLSPSAKKRNRKIRFVRTDGSVSFDGERASSFTGSFGSLKIKVPAIDVTTISKTDVPQVKAKLLKIKNTFSKEIAQAVQLTNVPEKVIESFIFVESSGNPNSKGGISIGLMQINPDTAIDVIWRDNKNGRLSDEEKTIIKSYIGESAFNSIIAQKWSGQIRGKVTDAQLYKPEFNILVGSAYIGILMDESTENGTVRLDKVIWRYNKGYFAKKGLVGDIKQVYANAGITQGYIGKIMGNNGTLDLLTKVV